MYIKKIFLFLLFIISLALGAPDTSLLNDPVARVIGIITAIGVVITIIAKVTKGIKSSLMNGLKEKISKLQKDHQSLDKTVNAENTKIKEKMNSISEHFNTLETKVNDLDRYFDNANKDRKEQDKVIQKEINAIRNNIREDINEVKNIIMKLMMSLKIED